MEHYSHVRMAAKLDVLQKLKCGLTEIHNDAGWYGQEAKTVVKSHYVTRIRAYHPGLCMSD